MCPDLLSQVTQVHRHYARQYFLEPCFLFHHRFLTSDWSNSVFSLLHQIGQKRSHFVKCNDWRSNFSYLYITCCVLNCLEKEKKTAIILCCLRIHIFQPNRLTWFVREMIYNLGWGIMNKLYMWLSKSSIIAEEAKGKHYLICCHLVWLMAILADLARYKKGFKEAKKQ